MQIEMQVEMKVEMKVEMRVRNEGNALCARRSDLSRWIFPRYHTTTRVGITLRQGLVSHYDK
eukprot:1318740-Amorphochlora_amoeboformis.AAC.1